MVKPNYGGTGWHIFANFALGVGLLLTAIFGAMFTHYLFLLLTILSIYFIYSGIRWARGSAIEERLKIREELIRFVQPKEGDKILDVGTGAGLLAIGFAKVLKKCEVVGIDIWIPLGGGTSLRNARRNAEIEGVADKVKFERADARDIPYPNDYFDIVVASFVIHMIRGGREKALREMVRVLRPGGKFAIIEPPRAGAGWCVDEKLREKLEEIGLKNVKFQPLLISYPKKRTVYIIYGEKRGAASFNLSKED